MYYFPVLDLYEKYKKHIHDFSFYILIYVTLGVADPFFRQFKLIVNPDILLLFFALFLYTLAYYLVRHYKLQKQFGGMFSHSLAYTIFLGLATFLFYLLWVRRKFQ